MSNAATQTSPAFDLDGLIRSELAKGSTPDPGIVADRVLRAIPDEHLREALSRILRSHVRQLASTQRHVALAATASTPTSSKSWKRDGVREAWQRMLKNPVHVGNSRHKYLADCTYLDLVAAANERHGLAAANHAWAKRFTGWADLMAQHEDAVTFGQLPQDVLRSALEVTS